MIHPCGYDKKPLGRLAMVEEYIQHYEKAEKRVMIVCIVKIPCI